MYSFIAEKKKLKGNKSVSEKIRKKICVTRSLSHLSYACTNVGSSVERFCPPLRTSIISQLLANNAVKIRIDWHM